MTANDRRAVAAWLLACAVLVLAPALWNAYGARWHPGFAHAAAA